MQENMNALLSEAYLREQGFVKDESAPDAIVRWFKQQNGCNAFYVTVTFRGGIPDWIFMRMTDYEQDGALVRTRTWDAKGHPMSVGDIVLGQEDLGITVISSAR